MQRIFDFVFALISLIILTPLFLVVAGLIMIESKGPILFVQDRLGKDRKIFKVLKFRTMTHKERKPDQQVYKHNPEITKVGYYLRRFKIDELPQIINVLKGEMSLVGPRPCLPNVEEKFELTESHRFDVKPGLTSMAGVNGSIYLSWDEKWFYDKYYVENKSVWLDMKIIIKTFLVVLFGEERFLNKPDLNQ